MRLFLQDNQIKKIIFIPIALFRKYCRNISDYFGSLKVKKFSHSSKILRTFRSGDLEKILKIVETCFENKNIDQIVKYSKLFRNIFYVFEINGVIIGYSGFYLHVKFVGLKRVQVATLYSIAMDNAYQQKGYGNQLLKESINEMQKNNVSFINLYVNINNCSAVNLYKKNGFKIINELKGICGKGSDCYQMHLDLVELYNPA